MAPTLFSLGSRTPSDPSTHPIHTPVNVGWGGGDRQPDRSSIARTNQTAAEVAASPCRVIQPASGEGRVAEVNELLVNRFTIFSVRVGQGAPALPLLLVPRQRRQPPRRLGGVQAAGSSPEGVAPWVSAARMAARSSRARPMIRASMRSSRSPIRASTLSIRSPTACRPLSIPASCCAGIPPLPSVPALGDPGGETAREVFREATVNPGRAGQAALPDPLELNPPYEVALREEEEQRDRQDRDDTGGHLVRPVDFVGGVKGGDPDFHDAHLHGSGDQ